MRKTSLLDALFPKTRQAVLATLYMDPGREWYLSDLARHLNVQPSSLQRELVRLAVAGILRRREDGNRAYYSAETENPIFGDLHGLLLRTAGLRDVLVATLEPFRDRLDVAFVHGSLARREERPNSDIDLMVIGRVGLAELAPAVKRAEATLLRPVNPSIYTPKEIAEKLASGHHFIGTVMSKEKLFVLGDNDDLAAATRCESRPDAHNEQAGARRPTDGHRT
jgi:DNA-binding transcriptional ArsR family regulator